MLSRWVLIMVRRFGVSAQIVEHNFFEERAAPVPLADLPLTEDAACRLPTPPSRWPTGPMRPVPEVHVEPPGRAADLPGHGPAKGRTYAFPPIPLAAWPGSVLLQIAPPKRRRRRNVSTRLVGQQEANDDHAWHARNAATDRSGCLHLEWPVERVD